MRRLIACACADDDIIATLDEAAGTTGLLIVSGGNEVRAGAHRGMALLAADLAAAGHPVFRYDRRGVGDSGGTNRGFLSAAPRPRYCGRGFSCRGATYPLPCRFRQLRCGDDIGAVWTRHRHRPPDRRQSLDDRGDGRSSARRRDPRALCRQVARSARMGPGATWRHRFGEVDQRTTERSRATAPDNPARWRSACSTR